MLFKKLTLYLGIGNHTFDSLQWQTKPNKRKCFLKDIIESGFLIGMTEKEVVTTLGIEFRKYTTGVWSYRIDTWYSFKKRSVLNLYFNAEGRVALVKLKYKIMRR